MKIASSHNLTQSRSNPKTSRVPKKIARDSFQDGVKAAKSTAVDGFVYGTAGGVAIGTGLGIILANNSSWTGHQIPDLLIGGTLGAVAGGLGLGLGLTAIGGALGAALGGLHGAIVGPSEWATFPPA